MPMNSVCCGCLRDCPPAKLEEVADDELLCPNCRRPKAEPDAQGRMWYAVAVFGGDRKAARKMKDWFKRKSDPKVIGRVLVPKAFQEVTRDGKVVQQYRRATPGYLLVRCHPDHLDELERCPAVGTVLPYADEVDADSYEEDPPPAPLAIPADQVQPFLKKGNRPDPTPIGIADPVRVRGGQWEGMQGEVIGLNNDGTRVIEVLVLGHPAEITEPVTNLQKLARFEED